jgi:hypothetical protein
MGFPAQCPTACDALRRCLLVFCLLIRRRINWTLTRADTGTLWHGGVPFAYTAVAVFAERARSHARLRRR